MSATLDGRVVLVTGAASGIGRATAHEVVARGGSVLALDRSAPGLDETAALAGAESGRIETSPGDVGDEDAVAYAVARAVGCFGRLDGVVTCAGIFAGDDLQPLENVTLDTFLQVLRVNLAGTFLAIKHAIPHLRRDDGELTGSVVTIASTAAIRGHGFGAGYTASKGGVAALTRLVAVQSGPQGIRANCICPGGVNTPMAGDTWRSDDAIRRTKRTVPLGHVAEAEDIASVAGFLLSDDARHVTGQVFAVDGGRDRHVTAWFGLFLPQLRMSFATILERTLAAEAAGFDSVWLMDHLAAPATPEHDTLEGWTLAAALAVRTTTIRVGHLVTCDPFRHPAVLAKMAATVDVLSDGRLELGLGWGSVERELETYGIGAGPPKARAARMRESIEILDLMFAGEPFDHDGAVHQLHGAVGRPRPVQLPRPPLHIGGAGPKLTMPIVRDHADWWNCPTYAIDQLAELRPLAGNARVSVQHPVGLATGAADRDETVAVAQRRFGSWGGLVAGTADEVADALAAEAASGVEGFVIQLTDFGQPETVARFMAEVAPTVIRT